MLTSTVVMADDGAPSDLLQFADAPACDARLVSLKDAHLGAGAREVRIWMGFYNDGEFKLVRFRVDSTGQIRGESFFPYSLMSNDAEKPYYDQIARQYTAFHRIEDWQAFRPNSVAQVHWGGAYRALQTLGLSRLSTRRSCRHLHCRAVPPSRLSYGPVRLAGSTHSTTPVRAWRRQRGRPPRCWPLSMS